MCYTKLVGQIDDWNHTSIIMLEKTGFDIKILFWMKQHLFY